VLDAAFRIVDFLWGVRVAARDSAGAVHTQGVGSFLEPA
jgi:hypothetical protein